MVKLNRYAQVLYIEKVYEQCRALK